MGSIICVGSSLDAERKKRENAIDKVIKERSRLLNSEVKILLLGAGESGKSTVAKQMKIIHLNGFTKAELITLRPVVYNNILESIKLLVIAMEKFRLAYDNAENESIAETFVDIKTTMRTTTISPELAKNVSRLWEDGGIQKAFARRSELQLPDSTAYVMKNLERIAEPDYLPSTKDALRVRARTTGIVETKFTIDGARFSLVDAGGQRSERKKWMHCFQDVTSVLYCVAMNEYDMQLYEDANVNRMREALNLFKEVCNNKWLTRASIILFMNKNDLFKKKITQVDLKVCFPEYKGGYDYFEATKFLEAKFQSVNEIPGKAIYTHVTTATETNNIRFVFLSVKNTIIETALALSEL